MGMLGVKAERRVGEAVDLVDRESRSLDGRGGVAVGMTATADPRPQGRDGVLQQPEYCVLRANVLEEPQLTDRFKNPAHLGECRSDLGYRTQHQRGDGRVE